MQDATTDRAALADERAMEFTRSFGGAEFFEEGFVVATVNMFTLASILFGEEHAREGFDLMVRGAFKRDPGPGWREVLEQDYNGIYSETAGGQLVHDLTAYADYGIVLAAARTAEDRETLLSEQIAAAEALLRVLPLRDWDLGGEHLVRILKKAIARWRVDTDQILDAEALALVSDRALQTIKNSMAGQNRRIHGTLRRIEPAEARGWLKSLPDFRESIWRDQNDVKAVEELDRGLGEVVFVPVAPDGSLFHPGLRREGTYRIDVGYGEQRIADYNEALTKLQTAIFPNWRRPTEGGSWTKVRGVDWRRLPLEELHATEVGTGQDKGTEITS